VYQVACALLEQWSPGGGAQIQAHSQWPEVQATVPNADTALHDSVTGLANRALLLTEMNQRMLRAARLPGYAVAALFLNVDRFRLINDSLGRAAGDRLLSEIATRLQAMVRKPGKVAQWPRDIVARTGGDEFVLLLDTIRASQDAAHVADRILNTLAKPITLDELEVVVSASIGIAMSSPACQQPEDILRDADTARYHAKREGNERSRIFDARMHDAAVKRLWMESDLRRAIDAGELTLHYQPIPSASTGKVAEVEALVRWQHPEHGLISPGDFIPLAEETGLIIPLGNWVLERACRQLREWDSSIPEFADVVVAVNVSGRQLMRPEFASEVTAILQRVGVRPERVKLEITESAMIASGSAATVRLAELREAGLQLHMDDFGSGYSSLSYLYRLPFVHLKMDRSFVEAMEVDQNARPVVEAIVKLGHSLHLKVVAEGVENAAQLSFLRQVGCDFLQGFYISPPVPAEQAAAYVGETNRSIALHALDRPGEMAIPTAIAA
jgi:diguanylate cyclase (GGDEF)-like protein